MYTIIIGVNRNMVEVTLFTPSWWMMDLPRLGGDPNYIIGSPAL